MLDANISQIQSGLDGSFTQAFLKNAICQTRVKITSCLYDRNEANVSQLRSLLEDLISTQKIFRDEGSAFAALHQERPRENAWNRLGLKTLDKTAFQQITWKHFYEQSQNLIADVEAQIFHQMVPPHRNTIRSLTEFIQLAPYNKKIMGANHKASEAFMLYYKLLTADGEPLTIEQFKEHITSKGLGIWKELFEAEQFTKYYAADLAKAKDWSRIVSNPDALENDLRKIIGEAAPREVAFLALQRIIQPYLKEKQYRDAHQTAVLYSANFIDKYPFSDMETKYRNLLVLFENMGKQNNNYIREPVIELESREEFVEFFFNPERTSLAVSPKAKGTMTVFHRTGQETFEQSDVIQADPGFMYYSFKQDDPRIKNKIEGISARTLQLEKITDGLKTTRDIHVNRKHKIAFLVCLSEDGRQDTLNQSPEFASPALVHSWAKNGNGYFQEYNHHKTYHGKPSGNPNTDIYYSLLVNGVWLTPRLLCQQDGSNYRVNTPFAERSPVLSADGGRLYFSSEGHAGFGGFDVYSVPITVQGPRMYVSGPIEHMEGVNTSGDELFYNRINDSLSYFSSQNETGQFQIYRLKKTKGKGKIPPPIPPRISESGLINMDSDILFEAQCIQLQEADPTLNGKEIWVVGRIFLKNKQLAQRGSVAFYPDNLPRSCTIDHSKGDSIYRVLLPVGRGSIDVRVIAYDEKNDSIEGVFRASLDSLCDNEGRDKQMHIDYVTEDITEVVANKVPLFVPVFFETGVSDAFVNIDPAMMQYFRDEFMSLKNNKIKFYFVGYADERGSKQINDRLSSERANTVRNFFISRLGYTAERTKAMAAGATTEFNNDDWKKYAKYIPDEYQTKYRSGIQKNWFQNRRVLIYFVY